MYIVAIAWLYVVLMMSLTERSVVAGVATFLLYGLAPLALFLWLVGTPARRRRRQGHERDASPSAQEEAPTSGMDARPVPPPSEPPQAPPSVRQPHE
ncbi:hypothetical protein [Imbroritus primus]|uniref:hypothetical protein n=1 Tax=Imbroritus primus TaxID=3058603 RepID=UPI0002DD56CE